MVLWEMTMVAAYFLGLKRTYKIALTTQRRLVGPNRPKIRQFLHRRTRNVFDAAVRVHKNVQERDIEVGRNLGNSILRWLDRMKPSAQIRPIQPPINNNLPKHVTGHEKPLGMQRSNMKSTEQESRERQLFTSLNTRSQSLSPISMMLQPKGPAGMSGEYRHLSYRMPLTRAFNYRKGQTEGVSCRDIAQWMPHN